MTKQKLLDLYNAGIKTLLVDYGSTDGKFVNTKFGQLIVHGDSLSGQRNGDKYIGLHTCFYDKDFKNQPYYKQLIKSLKDFSDFFFSSSIRCLLCSGN